MFEGFRHVGPNARRIRQARGQTQKQIADIAGLRQFDVSLIERGLPPHPHTVARLARALNTSVDALLAPIDDADAGSR